LRQILGIKSSNGLIRAQQKIVLQSSLKQNYGFPSQVRRVNLTAVLVFLCCRLNRLLWTPQCRLLLVDSLTQSLPGWGPFCRRGASRNDSCVHFKWGRMPGGASFVFGTDFRRLEVGSGAYEKEQRYPQDPRIHL